MSAPRVRAILLLPLLLAVAVLFGPAPVATAHSNLEKSAPADGSTVKVPPTEVVLTFNEDLSPDITQVSVFDGEGLPMTKGKPSVTGRVLTQPLQQPVHPGAYAVTYKVISADGHPVTGTLTFTVSASATTTPSTSSAPPATSSTSTSSPSASGPTATPLASGTSSTTSPTTGAGDSSSTTTLWLILILCVLALVTVLSVIARRGRRSRGRTSGNR